MKYEIKERKKLRGLALFITFCLLISGIFFLTKDEAIVMGILFVILGIFKFAQFMFFKIIDFIEIEKEQILFSNRSLKNIKYVFDCSTMVQVQKEPLNNKYFFNIFSFYYKERLIQLKFRLRRIPVQTCFLEDEAVKDLDFFLNQNMENKIQRL